MNLTLVSILFTNNFFVDYHNEFLHHLGEPNYKITITRMSELYNTDTFDTMYKNSLHDLVFRNNKYDEYIELDELLDTMYVTKTSYSRKYRLFVLCNYYTYLKFVVTASQGVCQGLCQSLCKDYDDNNLSINYYGNGYGDDGSGYDDDGSGAGGGDGDGGNDEHRVEWFVNFMINNELCKVHYND